MTPEVLEEMRGLKLEEAKFKHCKRVIRKRVLRNGDDECS